MLSSFTAFRPNRPRRSAASLLVRPGATFAETVFARPLMILSPERFSSHNRPRVAGIGVMVGVLTRISLHRAWPRSPSCGPATATMPRGLSAKMPHSQSAAPASHSLFPGWVLSPSPLFRDPAQQ